MANKRGLITMSEDEVDAFLSMEKTMNVATIGADGSPHLVAMWYCKLDGYWTFWTFAKSQKALNLARDPRLSALVESGESYEELKGVQLRARGIVLTDSTDVERVGEALVAKYTPNANALERKVFLDTAGKRVAVRLEIVKVASWDHSKLNGQY